jgi:hypothetical protein
MMRQQAKEPQPLQPPLPSATVEGNDTTAAAATYLLPSSTQPHQVSSSSSKSSSSKSLSISPSDTSPTYGSPILQHGQLTNPLSSLPLSSFHVPSPMHHDFIESMRDKETLPDVDAAAETESATGGSTTVPSLRLYPQQRSRLMSGPSYSPELSSMQPLVGMNSSSAHHQTFVGMKSRSNSAVLSTSAMYGFKGKIPVNIPVILFDIHLFLIRR